MMLRREQLIVRGNRLRLVCLLLGLMGTVSCGQDQEKTAASKLMDSYFSVYSDFRLLNHLLRASLRQSVDVMTGIGGIHDASGERYWQLLGRLERGAQEALHQGKLTDQLSSRIHSIFYDSLAARLNDAEKEILIDTYNQLASENKDFSEPAIHSLGGLVSCKDHDLLISVISDLTDQPSSEVWDQYIDLCDKLFTSVKEGRIEELQQLIAKHERAVHYTADGGYTLLMFAALWGQADMVELLIAEGASVDQGDYSKGLTPLICAIAKQHVEAARLLIDKGAKVHLTDNGGASPLLYARKHGLSEIVTLLVNKGATQSR